jgi:hypothetical protein
MIRMLTTFHPNHIGAQIGQQAGAERAGEHVGEIQDSDSRQGRGKGYFCGGHGVTEL